MRSTASPVQRKRLSCRPSTIWTRPSGRVRSTRRASKSTWRCQSCRRAFRRLPSCCSWAPATKEAFEWAIGVPDVVTASGEVARFLNDIASYKKGKNKKDAASSVECYAKENGVSGEEAVAAIVGMAENAWRTINRACMEIDRTLLPAVQLVVNLTKTLEVIYLGGRDAYTFSGDLKDLVVSLFVNGPTV